MKTIQPSERKVIRFAVGTPETPSSFVWRLWTTRKDAYMTLASGAEPKFSMHGNVWKADFGTQRHSFRPIDCTEAPGWTQGPAVMFCNVPYQPLSVPADLVSDNQARKGLLWFPFPPQWHLAEFVVLFASPDTPLGDLPPTDRTVDGEVYAIGPLPLNDGRRVWLRYLSKPIPEDRHEYLLSIRATAQGMRATTSREELEGLAVIFHLHESTIVGLPLGAETIETTVLR